jgi:hypothetical protein
LGARLPGLGGYEALAMSRVFGHNPDSAAFRHLWEKHQFNCEPLVLWYTA